MARAAERDQRRRRWLAAALLVASLSGYQAVAEWRDRHAFLINGSQSLPNWAFFLDRDRAPVAGDYVFFPVPAGPVVAKHFGATPPPFGKQVLGMPGQTVRHWGRLVTIDHQVVAATKPRSRLGIPLAIGPDGVIPDGCYYVGSGHPDGFDSRYAAIGFVCRRQLIGVGTAIL